MSKVKTFCIGGIHPDKHKITADSPITNAGLPEKVTIPVRQHIGAPAKILVQNGDKVKVGTLLAEADGVVSSNIHSSVSGTITKVDTCEGEFGYFENMITINVEGDDFEPSIKCSDEDTSEIPQDPKEIIEKIKAAGIVGMGGAGFPTPIKTSIPEGKKVDTLIINGIECEPFLTADDRLMVECAEQIITGTRILNKALGIQNAIIAIDENKPAAIEKLTALSKTNVGVNVVACATKYPQGGEKQLIAAITGRQVPSGKLPIDAGCIVQNVGTAYAVYEAVIKNKPLIERIVTVSGDTCLHPANYRVRIGTPASFLIEKSGGVTEDTSQVVFGGPMMGTSAYNINAPVTKLTNGILLLSEKLTTKGEAGDCIRCGRCAAACPMGLQPFLIGRLMKNNQVKELKSIDILDCIECGCCAYTCPEGIPLLDYCKLAKAELKKDH